MKFRIVENPDPFDGIDVDEFKEDYKNMRNRELFRKYKIYDKKLRKLREKLNLPKKKGGMGTTNPKYYSFNNSSNNWKIEKNRTYFGVAQTEDEAKKVVEFLKENNWNEKLVAKNTAKYYYFHKKSNKWMVQKNDVYFGVFQTVEEAKKVVDFLKKNNWDKELLLKNKNKILKKEAK